MEILTLAEVAERLKISERAGPAPARSGVAHTTGACYKVEMGTLLFWGTAAVLFVWYNVTTEAERGRAWTTLVVLFVIVFGGLIAARFTWTMVTEGPVAAVKMFGGESAPPTY